MTKRMTDTLIEQVKQQIDTWSSSDGPLTWEAICTVVKVKLGREYTRQGLHKIEGIRIAYTVRRNALKRLIDRTGTASTEMQRVLERAAGLAAERDRLRAENQALLEQFVVWTYNASTKGLDPAFLSRPLPPIDRDATPGPKRRNIRRIPGHRSAA